MQVEELATAAGVLADLGCSFVIRRNGIWASDHFGLVADIEPFSSTCRASLSDRS